MIVEVAKVVFCGKRICLGDFVCTLAICMLFILSYADGHYVSLSPTLSAEIPGVQPHYNDSFSARNIV